MLIHELSNRTGLAIPTLRYYESYGLISGKPDIAVRSNKYKHYDEQTVETVEWIVHAKTAGFTLAEVKRWLGDWYNKKLSPAKKLEIVQAKIGEVDEKIAQLKKIRKRLLTGLKEIENDEC